MAELVTLIEKPIAMSRRDVGNDANYFRLNNNKNVDKNQKTKNVKRSRAKKLENSRPKNKENARADSEGGRERKLLWFAAMLFLATAQFPCAYGLTCACSGVVCPEPRPAELQQKKVIAHTKGGVKGALTGSFCEVVPVGPCGCCRACAAELGASCGGKNPRCKAGLVCKPKDPLFVVPAGYDPPGTCISDKVPRCETSNSPSFPRVWLPLNHWRMSRDACTLCWCARPGGVAKCLTQTCPDTPPCANPIQCPGICCPICL